MYAHDTDASISNTHTHNTRTHLCISHPASQKIIAMIASIKCENGIGH